MPTSDPLLAIAERVAREAEALGIEAAIIGGIAVAMRGAPCATLDVDLGVATSLDQLRALAERLASIGYHIALRVPDDDDPLGGVIDVWEEEIVDADGDPVPAGLVQVVNLRGDLGHDAVTGASVLGGFRVCALEELVALKLAAGSRRDERDVLLLLEANPTSVDTLRLTCARYGLREVLDRLIE